MEAATAPQSPISITIPHKFISSRPSLSHFNPNPYNLPSFSSKFRLSKSLSPSPARLGAGRRSFGSRKSFMVRSSLSSNSSESVPPVAPLRLESPVGQFLSEILVNHPHLVPAAVDQQLEQLQTDLEAEKNKEELSASSTELVLYKRIAEVKANERRKALQEILYTLVVQKFMDAGISLIPSISSSSSGRVDTWPSEDKKLELVHSPEVNEMIQNHLALILGNRLGDTMSVAQISKLRAGQVYAASVMYGYFLKRLDQRFQLEKAMRMLPEHTDEREKEIFNQSLDAPSIATKQSVYNHVQTHPEVSSWAGSVSPGGFGPEHQPSRLRSYVMSFDAETLSRYATIRSKESITIIEKHTEALFGKPEIVITPEGTIDPTKDELIKIGFGGLKRLIMEAVTFGSFLWDVESYVESRCHYALN